MSLHILRKATRRWVAVFLLSAALVPVTTASAQPTPPQDQAKVQPQAAEDAAIVVTGTSMREQLEVIRDYVDGLTIAVSYDPLARYASDSYCPAVLGLSPSRNDEIATRMRAVAKAAGVQPAASGCRTSALVMFVDDKESFLTAFRRKHPVYFSDLRRTHGRFPPREKGPATAWHLVATLDPQGTPVERTGLGPTIVASPMRGSRILSMVTQVVAMSVVIIERGALVGLTSTQIADYALMRTLTDRSLKAPDVPGQFTILRALTTPKGSAVPLSLTRWDLAYLEGRYSGHPARYGPGQRAAIAQRLRRAAKQSEGN